METKPPVKIAIAGNPNVGKSTIFNALTGMHQHTGNWTGKTVSLAEGKFKTDKNSYIIYDLPGTYSLVAHSKEEEVARDFLCFEEPSAVIVVCDATCLERNMNLVLQTMEICKNVLVCVNLIDEAERKGIEIDLERLSQKLGVTVVGTVARNKNSIKKLKSALDEMVENPNKCEYRVHYPAEIENSLFNIEKTLFEELGEGLPLRWLALRLLERDESLCRKISEKLGVEPFKNPRLVAQIGAQRSKLKLFDQKSVTDIIASSLVSEGQRICSDAVKTPQTPHKTDQRVDRFLTGRFWSYPAMIFLLVVVLWITLFGANYPSSLLSNFLFSLEKPLCDFLNSISVPKFFIDALVFGVFRVLSWVVSVMLPPMAIFFPLFTLLEDLGYLPRIAYNLDKPFEKCGACGKQALTMCMGLGCNAVGVTGARIIDSPRERLLAILTNNFIPCNGRFPTLIAIITMFFIGGACGVFGSFVSALILAAVIVFAVCATFFVTRILSKTLLKGKPSAFILELPPYRKPQVAKTIVRSIFDRTLFVLGRAAAVAAPAGLVLYLLSNIYLDGTSILNICAEFLDPFATILGLDGIILIAFILGFPANEIVFPIIIMAYLSKGTLEPMGDLSFVKDLLVSNGWTYLTAVNVMLFSVLHWPCSSTLLTVKKETGSLKYTALSLIIPTLCAFLTCAATNLIFKIFI